MNSYIVLPYSDDENIVEEYILKNNIKIPKERVVMFEDFIKINDLPSIIFFVDNNPYHEELLKNNREKGGINISISGINSYFIDYYISNLQPQDINKIVHRFSKENIKKSDGEIITLISENNIDNITDRALIIDIANIQKIDINKRLTIDKLIREFNDLQIINYDSFNKCIIKEKNIDIIPSPFSYLAFRSLYKNNFFMEMLFFLKKNYKRIFITLKSIKSNFQEEYILRNSDSIIINIDSEDEIFSIKNMLDELGIEKKTIIKISEKSNINHKKLEVLFKRVVSK